MLSASGADPKRWGHGAAVPVIYLVFLLQLLLFSPKSPSLRTSLLVLCPEAPVSSLGCGAFLVWAMGSLWPQPSVHGMSGRRDLPDVLLMNHAGQVGFTVR